MITRLFVEGYEIDLIQDIDVDFTFSITDIQDIEKRTTSFSKTIAIPNTPNNANVFGHIYDISVENDYNPAIPNIGINFNPAKQAKAVLYVDNVRIYDGVIRLININDKQGEIIYECNLFGKLKDILYAIGDDLLEDLDFSDYDHTYDFGEVQASWSRTQWVDGADNYVYPLTDYGYGVSATNYEFTNFKPALFVREIIKRIFDNAGFKIDPGFFDTAYFKKLILVKGDLLTKNITEFLDVWATSKSYFGTLDNGLLSLPIVDVNLGFTINGASNRFTSNRPTYKANIGFEAVSISMDNTGHGFTATTTISIVKNGTTVVATQTWTAPPSVPYLVNNPSFSVLLDIANGDYFELAYSFQVDIASTTSIDFGISAPRLKVFNTLPQQYPVVYGDTLLFNETLPKQIKQRDFLKSIITMHNLYVEADPVQDNLLNFVPYPLYYETDKAMAKDWTFKLDKSQSVKIIPLGELTAREYNISYTPDNDYWGQLYQTKFNETYGEYQRLVDNDFETDSKDIKVLFGTPLMREEAGGRKVIHLYKVQNSVKQPDNFKSRIALWKPNKPCSSWNITYTGGTISGLLSYPYAGHLDDPDTPTIDICFDAPKEVSFTINTYPSDNLGNGYYNDFFNAITDKDSKLLQGYFYLTPLDIKNLEFNSLIKVGNHYFRIQKIEQYNPYANGLCLVTLIKVISGLFSTAPYLLNEDGTYLLQENGTSKFYI